MNVAATSQRNRHSAQVAAAPIAYGGMKARCNASTRQGRSDAPRGSKRFSKLVSWERLWSRNGSHCLRFASLLLAQIPMPRRLYFAHSIGVLNCAPLVQACHRCHRDVSEIWGQPVRLVPGWQSSGDACVSLTNYAPRDSGLWPIWRGCHFWSNNGGDNAGA